MGGWVGWMNEKRVGGWLGPTVQVQEGRQGNESKSHVHVLEKTVGG